MDSSPEDGGPFHADASAELDLGYAARDASISEAGVDSTARDGMVFDAGAPQAITEATLEHAARFGRAVAYARYSCAGEYAAAVGPGPEREWPFSEDYFGALLLVAGGRVGVDLGRLEACERFALDGVCDEHDETCRAPELMFRGRMQYGEGCVWSFDCLEGVCSSEYGECGKCLRPDERRSVGKPCEGPGRCLDGLFCVLGRCSAGEANDPCRSDHECVPALVCATDHCAPRGGVGAPCHIGDDCAAGHFCRGGTCLALLHEEEPCLYDSECVEGLMCPGPARVCIPRPRRGEPCVATYQCPEGDFCDGLCAPKLPEGAPCRAAHNLYPCQDGLSCDPWELVCVRPSPIGREVDAPCVSSTCDLADRGLVCTGQGFAARCEQASIVERGETCSPPTEWPRMQSCRGRQDVCSESAGGWTCRAPPLLGETCSGGCAENLVCYEGVCVPMPVEGERCLGYELVAYCAPGYVCGQNGCTSATALDPECP